MKMFFVAMRFGIDFEPLACMNKMRKFFQQGRDRLLYAMHLLRLAGGVALLAAFSWEVLLGPTHHLSDGYLQLQLVVCLLFLADFGVSWAFAARRKHYFFRHLIYLLLSIPWLNLIAWSGVHLTRPWQVLTGMIPVWLLVLATYLLIEWFNELRIARLFYTYLAATLLCTYLGALIFYEVEGGREWLDRWLWRCAVVGGAEPDDTRRDDPTHDPHWQDADRAAAPARDALSAHFYYLYYEYAQPPRIVLRPPFDG